MSLRQTLTSYNPDEFFPVYREGELDNKAEFIAYKAEQFAVSLGSLARHAAQVVGEVGGIVLDHIAQ